MVAAQVPPAARAVTRELNVVGELATFFDATDKTIYPRALLWKDWPKNCTKKCCRLQGGFRGPATQDEIPMPILKVNQQG